MKKLLAFLYLCLCSWGAYAQFDPSNVYEIRNRYSGKLLDMTGGSYANGAPVTQYTDNATAAQQWRLQPADNNPGTTIHFIVNRGSGKALEVDGTAANGSGIVQNTKSGGMPQYWLLLPASTGYYKLVNYDNSAVGRAMEVDNADTSDGARVQIWEYVGQSHQEWAIVDITDRFRQPGAFQAGVFKLRNSSGKLLEVNNATSTTGEAVQQWSDAGQPHQQWYFEQPDFSVNPNHYRIINRNSGMALEIESNSPYNGALAQQNFPSTGSGQLWRLEVYGSATPTQYVIRNINGKVLEIDGSSSANGARAQQWARDVNAPGQIWYLEYVSYSRSAATTAAASSAGLSDAAAVATKSTATPAELRVYPNPARTTLTLTVGAPASVTVTDAHGRTAPVRILDNGQVDVSALVPGLYMVHVREGQHVYRQKFIKE